MPLHKEVRQKQQSRQFTLRRRKQQRDDGGSSDQQPDLDTEVGNIGEIQVKVGLALQENNDGVDYSEQMRELWKLLVDAKSPTLYPVDNNMNPAAWDSSSSLPSDVEYLQLTPAEDNDDQQRPRRRFHRLRKKKEGGKTEQQKRRMRRRFKRRSRCYIARFRSDIVGIAFLEILQANDLPPEKNSMQ